MRITFLVNNVATEVPPATSTILSHAAMKLGHTVHVLGIDQLTYFEDGRIGGLAHVAPANTRTKETFLAALQEKDAPRERITTDDMDVFWLRYNPSEEAEHDRAWAQHSGILFGRLAMARGVIVLNHPDTLAYAIDKLYFQHFPEAVRPATIVTRDIDEIRSFHERCGGKIVMKPLNGYGGSDVFLVEKDLANLRQMVDTIQRVGYVMAQEFLPGDRTDTRFFMVNGEPLVVDGKYAALQRVAQGEDFRSNMSAGGKGRKAKVTDRMLELASIVGPKLKRDGIFFAGLDIVADRIVEINCISTGGLNISGRLQDVDFATPVIEMVERKVEIHRRYGGHISNIELATMR
ncbi:MAG: glutathione synthase [Gemmatimonadetes bacterium]|nr:glutathione synthase [Gemmatimonadota bacterium]